MSVYHASEGLSCRQNSHNLVDAARYYFNLKLFYQTTMGRISCA